jgi:nucleoid-associated protein YgaU
MIEHMFATRFAVRILVVAVFILALWAVLARDTDAAGTGATYRVRAGDTLWSIAAVTYRGDTREGVWKLERRNGLADTTIHPGQVLILP